MKKYLSIICLTFCLTINLFAQSLEFNDDEGNNLMLINDEGTTGSVLTDKIGIGTSNPLSPLSVGSDGNANYTIYGWNTITDGVGVYGRATNVGFSLGGLFVSVSDDGVGAFGASIGNGNGVYGKAEGNGHGVYSESYGTGNGVLSIAKGSGHAIVANAEGNGEGIHAESFGSSVAIFAKAYEVGNNYNHGGYFESDGNQANGIFTKANGLDGYGIYATASGDNSNGVFGRSTGSNGVGVRGIVESASQYRIGVDGWTNSPNGFGVHGSASDANGIGVKGWTDGSNAISIMGDANGLDGIGVFGIGNGTNGRGIVGEAPANGTAYAGWFNGNVHVTGNITYGGTISQSGSSIVMNHPTDVNKNIVHSGVSSSEMKNIYDGRVVTNSNGDAVINLPEWFEELNKDFRYQLTVIGEFAQAIVAEELINNEFSIKTNKPNVKVSWQITGIRNDSYANENRVEVEVSNYSIQKDRFPTAEYYKKINDERENSIKRLEEQDLAMQQSINQQKIRNQEQKVKVDKLNQQLERRSTSKSESNSNVKKNKNN